MSDSDRSPWYSLLHELLQSEADDEEILDFIEDNVPAEGEIVDFKSDMYISARSAHHTKRRQSEFIKYCSAFSNVVHPAERRYLFIGFDDPSEEFEGIRYRDDQGGDHILDVDDARLRNVLTDAIYPIPNFEFFELEADGRRGGVLAIERAEHPPTLLTKTLRASDGSEFVAEGQAYTREGSKTVVMDNAAFREIIETRERLIDQKLQEMADSMGQVVGIPSEQLADLDLKVAPSGEGGIRIGEFVTTSPPSDNDEKLTSAVKSWGGTADLLSNRSAIYEFYDVRKELRVDEDRKAEFLFRSCLRAYVTGAEWFTQYESNEDELFARIIGEQEHEYTIRNLEHVLLVLGKQGTLQTIADDGDIWYRRSKAAKYTELCDEPILDRVCEYVGTHIEVGGTSYSVEDLLDAPAEADELVDEVIENLMDRDSVKGRGQLREIELVRLGAEMMEEERASEPAETVTGTN